MRSRGGICVGMCAAVLAAACATNPAGTSSPAATAGGSSGGDGEALALLAPSARQRKLAAMKPAKALPSTDVQTRLGSLIEAYFQQHASSRGYLSLDKPLYRPGETVWFRSWQLSSGQLTASSAAGTGSTVELVSPKGAAVITKRVQAAGSVSTNDLVIPEGVPGGEYTLRVTSDTGGATERTFIISSYQPPRIKKKLEFLRKAYGPGDQVAASFALHRATGEPLAAFAAVALAVVDGQQIVRAEVTTDSEGNGIARFLLPPQLARGDGLLTILVNDGGITESIQRRIPIALDKLQVTLYPEGGELIAGLPARVYFAARTSLDEPADITGRILDDRGELITEARSLHNGMGRFELTPRLGRSYRMEITQPVGIAGTFELPAAVAAGCSLQAVDDFNSERDQLKVAVWCSEARTVVATAVVRERRLGAAAVDVVAGKPVVIALPAPTGRQGAVRVTLFDEAMRPLAERLVYRGRGADLKVSVRADRDSYSPRDKVVLEIETRDLAGKPVQADLALAVADDTVLSYADDKTAHMLAELYLEAEMPGQEIEEPNFYFSDDPKASAALDLVLGTQGWRRFQWQQVLAPQPTGTGEAMPGGAKYNFEDDAVDGAMLVPEVAVEDKPAPPPPKAPREVEQQPVADNKLVEEPEMAFAQEKKAQRRQGAKRGGRAKRDKDWEALGGDEDREFDELAAYAPVRQFPVPNYSGRYDGPRTDFRETVFWKPDVSTGTDGKATVEFYLSDSITSFRASAEGLSGGGLPGRGGAMVQSKLPVSLAVKMPLEVSAGDTIALPVMLSNETQREYVAELQAEFGPAFKVTGTPVPTRVSLAAGERKAYFYELSVVGNGKQAADGAMRVRMSTGSLADEVERTVSVVPLGFPQQASIAGTLEQRAVHTVDLRGALPGTIEASLTLYPSPLATMTKGTEAIIREPHGCFEQASSANYPNIMVLSYLEQHEVADPDLIGRTHGLLDKGYKMLTGYESPEKGYEWFGGDPGHEALTAYGLMEFVDMTAVYDDVDRTMIRRTAAWLRSRRDGKGGYQRNSRALDSFGRASDEVTNGYITWALTEAGEAELTAELAYQRKLSASSSDPYLLALAANSLLNSDPESSSTRAAVTKLASLQSGDGSFPGADHSITRSGGQALAIETTSLATLALIKAGPSHESRVRESIQWLDAQRSGWGGYGSTQSTVLALRAMSSYASASRKTRAGGVATLLINGKPAGKLSYEAGQADAMVFAGISDQLVAGPNRIELQLDSDEPIPYSGVLSWRSKLPASSPQSAVSVATRLDRAEVPMGQSARMTVTVRNVTAQGIPMTLARVGLPGGLTFQTWQLQELRDRKLIDFYETREREVILYFRSLAPEARHEISLDLTAAVPGSYVGPASSAYLYYTDELKHWAEPVRITVTSP